MFRVTGRFAVRPYPIEFELLFQPVGGEWRLYGVAIVRGAPMPIPKPAPPKPEG
jgi:hypothetical protein